MAKKSSDMKLSELLSKSVIMADNILLNAEKISRYGLELPAFADGMKTQADQLSETDKEQERLKSLLKTKTEELKDKEIKLKKDYAQAKKTVKLAESQANWKAYGIDDKK